MDKRKYTLLWLLPLMAMTLAFIISFEGCTPKPTEAPSTTVITGTGQMSVSPDNTKDTYYFQSGALSYGKIYLNYAIPLLLEGANGIVSGSGSVAPDTGYFPTSGVIDGQSYFVRTDKIIHYCKLTVTGTSQQSSYYIVRFQWVLQTEANNRNLY